MCSKTLKQTQIRRFLTLNTDQVKSDLEELENRDEIQDYLEELWESARREAYNIERLMFLHNFDEDLDTDDVIKILEQDINEDEAEHK